MEVRRFIIPYHWGEILRGYPVGCEHFGTKHTAEGIARRKYKQIAGEPLSFWWNMGDKGDFITPSDPRWRHGTIADWVKEDNIATNQEDFYCDVVKEAVRAEIADYGIGKCVGLLWGNHEDKIRKHNHVNVQENICTKLGVENLGFSCMLHIIFRRVNSTEAHMFKGYITHGSGNAQTRGGKLMKLRKIMNQVRDVDFVAVGHMHDIIIETAETLQTNKEMVIGNKEVVGAITGCFLRTYTQGVEAGYGELRNYDPVPLGCPVFIFDPTHGTVTVSRG